MAVVRTAGSVGDALAAATDALAAAGVDSPRLDAELMLAEASGIERAAFAADPEAALDPGAGRLFSAMVRRRLRREPLAYIVGRKGFREIELAVDRRALIPRPETELLVEVALELGPRSVLEVGTGSGAVALALAREVPELEVVATDTSAAALELARSNAIQLGVSDRVRFVAGTLPSGGRFDVLVANLPYVAEAEWPGLAPEIREWEPREALLAGPDGLTAIRSLLDRLTGADPSPAAAVALEVGAGQAAPVAGLLADAGFAMTEVRPDLAGIDRVVLGRC
jgi:release factor glutamine methyltransferase